VGATPAAVPEPGSQLTDLDERLSVPLASGPTVGYGEGQKGQAHSDVHDALTLAGRILYRAMYGSPEATTPGTAPKATATRRGNPFG